MVRPGDANETAWAWRMALEHTDRPDRAGAEPAERCRPSTAASTRSAEGVAKGGYILAEASNGQPQVILIGTGSEVQLCVTARERLEAEGTPTRVVSMPCQEWFDEQDEAYRQTRAAAATSRPGSASRPASRCRWRDLVGDAGECVSIEHYGASAPHTVLFEQFGFTPDNVVAPAHASLARAGDDHRLHHRQLRERPRR